MTLPPSCASTDQAGSVSNSRKPATAGSRTRPAWRLTRDGHPALTKVWYSTTDHGGLVKDTTVVAAVSDLLRVGATEKLPSDPPPTARRSPTAPNWVSGEDLEAAPIVEPNALTNGLRGRGLEPTATDGARSQLCRRSDEQLAWHPTTSPRQPGPPSDSRFATPVWNTRSHLVVVGHYAGTVFGGAEGYADRLLDGRLTVRQVLGRYPSTPSDVLRILPDPGDGEASFAGVVVVGLGEMGELTPTGSPGPCATPQSNSAGSVPPRPSDADDETGARRPRLACSSAATAPTPCRCRPSSSALVEGVLLANRELAETITGRTVRIDELELVELYAQRAEEAARDRARARPLPARGGARRLGRAVRRAVRRRRGRPPGRAGRRLRDGHVATV